MITKAQVEAYKKRMQKEMRNAIEITDKNIDNYNWDGHSFHTAGRRWAYYYVREKRTGKKVMVKFDHADRYNQYDFEWQHYR